MILCFGWKKCKPELNKMNSVGKYVEGQTSDPKTWKANFRCAMNSLPDIEEVKDRSINKGHQAMRVFRMLPATPKSRGETSDRKWANTKKNMNKQWCAAPIGCWVFFLFQSVCSTFTLWAVGCQVTKMFFFICTDKRSKAKEAKQRNKVNTADIALFYIVRGLFKLCHAHIDVDNCILMMGISCASLNLPVNCICRAQW